MRIIGHYKDWTLVEKDERYLVINQSDKKVLYEGTEKQANKIFVMLVAKFIDEKFLKIES